MFERHCSPCRWQTHVVRLLALFAFAACSVAPSPQTARSSETFYWKAEGMRGEVAAVYARGQVVFRVRQEMGGYLPADRADLVVDRLADYFSGIGFAHEIRPGVRNGQAVVLGREMVLVTVSPASAKANQTSPERVAWLWSNNIRRALGVEPLGESAIPSADVDGFETSELNHGARARITGNGSTLDENAASPVLVTQGIASWYGEPFHLRKTANGELFDMNDLTAAHPSWPFGTIVRVRKPDSNRSVVVRINDRGPFVQGRNIDLSWKAANQVGLDRDGVGPVIMEVLAWGN